MIVVRGVGDDIDVQCICILATVFIIYGAGDDGVGDSCGGDGDADYDGGGAGGCLSCELLWKVMITFTVQVVITLL